MYMFYAAVSFFIGTVLGYILNIPQFIIVISFILILSVLFINRKNKKLSILTIMVLICLLAMSRYSYSGSKLSKFESYTGNRVELECVVIEEPSYNKDYVKCTVKATALHDGDKTYTFREKMILKYKGKQKPVFGDLIKVNGKILDISDRRNPGDFDYTLYYKSKGIYKNIEANKLEVKAHNQAGTLATFLYNAMKYVKGIIYSALPDEEAAVLYGIITGQKTDMDEDTIEEYSKVGLSHILSVSGLHIGFIVIMISYPLKRFKLDVWIESFIISSAVFLYILLIGMPSPAVRSFIMLVLLIWGKVLKRDYDLLASVSAALIFMLMIKPLYIHDPGFIISFACMYSIALLFEPVQKAIKFLPALIRNSIALSVTVQLGIIPIMIYYFNYLSFISIIVNIIAIPIAFIITIMGFAGVIIGIFSSYLALYVFSIAYYMLRLLGYIVSTVSQYPWAGIFIPSLPIYLYLIYYIFVFNITGWFGAKLYKLYKREILVISLTLLIAGMFLYNMPSENIRILFFDIGQGDSSCIIAPNKKVILIDGGGSTRSPDYYFNVGKKLTVPALLHSGIWRIDTIVASHIHDDHIEGLIEVLKTFKVNNIAFPRTQYTSPIYEEIIKVCHKKKINIVYLKEGDFLKLADKVHMKVLSPMSKPIDDESSAGENNNSMVVKLTYKDLDVLFTGDIQAEGEQLLINKDIKSDIIKIPHHGSRFSTTQGFIGKVEPALAVISVGKNNFGHPSKEVLTTLKNKGIRTYRTDTDGAVIITSDGYKIKIGTVRQR